jgi:cytochrome c biogenesis protein CcmG/thiol:disulfide interchange protein DsbE
MEFLLMKTFFARNQSVVVIIILITGLFWIGITSIYIKSTSGSKISIPKEGFPAPDFGLLTPDGEMYQLSTLNDQAILVNFWTSWCPPCKKEMPALESVYQSFKDRGFLVLAVNATHQDSASKAASFSRDNGLTFPVLLDIDGSITSKYQIHSFPTTFFIDKDGFIQEIIIGGPMAEALLRTRVENLLMGRE